MLGQLKRQILLNKLKAIQDNERYPDLRQRVPPVKTHIQYNNSSPFGSNPIYLKGSSSNNIFGSGISTQEIREAFKQLLKRKRWRNMCF